MPLHLSRSIPVHEYLMMLQFYCNAFFALLTACSGLPLPVGLLKTIYAYANAIQTSKEFRHACAKRVVALRVKQETIRLTLFRLKKMRSKFAKVCFSYVFHSRFSWRIADL